MQNTGLKVWKPKTPVLHMKSAEEVYAVVLEDRLNNLGIK